MVYNVDPFLLKPDVSQVQDNAVNGRINYPGDAVSHRYFLQTFIRIFWKFHRVTKACDLNNVQLNEFYCRNVVECFCKIPTCT